jgi:chromosome transmission fidelity protein 1
MLSNYVTIIPDGIVLFFSSYYMEEMIISRWKETGILDRINSKKKVFREPRNASGVDQVLKEYSEVIENNFVQHSAGTKQPIPKPKGALLSCVVGGKLSEGINFKVPFNVTAPSGCLRLS